MTTIAVASARHSPGVTTTVVALAAAWPAHRRVLVVEADPAGGDLICRYGFMAEPSLLTLAATTRSTVTAESLWANAQHLPNRPDARAVVAPIDPGQATAAVATLVRAGLGQTVVDHSDVDVLVDVGRLAPDSPAIQLFASADVAVMVARSTLAQAAHLEQRIAWFQREIELVIVGEHRWKPEELAANVGAARVLAALPDDPDAAVALYVPGRGARVLQRSALWRSVRALAELLAGPVPSPPAVEAPAPPAPLGLGRAIGARP